MANVAASTTLSPFGPIHNGSCKVVCVGFATADTADILHFDTSNVGIEAKISKIFWADVITATGALTSIQIASNNLTIASANISAGATNVTAFVIGI